MDANGYVTDFTVADAPAGTQLVSTRGYDSTDVRSFREAFDQALRSSDQDLQGLQSQLRERYSWEKVGQRTLEVYRSLAGRA